MRGSEPIDFMLLISEVFDGFEVQKRVNNLGREREEKETFDVEQNKREEASKRKELHVHRQRKSANNQEKEKRKRRENLIVRLAVRSIHLLPVLTPPLSDDECVQDIESN